MLQAMMHSVYEIKLSHLFYQIIRFNFPYEPLSIIVVLCKCSTMTRDPMIWQQNENRVFCFVQNTQQYMFSRFSIFVQRAKEYFRLILDVDMIEIIWYHEYQTGLGYHNNDILLGITTLCFLSGWIAWSRSKYAVRNSG